MSKGSNHSPEKIIHHMFKNDEFSQWLGIQIVDVQEGACILQCTLTEKMMNGYKIAHGGVLFSLADSAIAFTSASYGWIAVAIDHSISFLKKTVTGDMLTIKAETVSMGHKTGVIRVEIENSDHQLVAVVKGTVYRTSKTFDL